MKFSSRNKPYIGTITSFNILLKDQFPLRIFIQNLSFKYLNWLFNIEIKPLQIMFSCVILVKN